MPHLGPSFEMRLVTETAVEAWVRLEKARRNGWRNRPERRSDRVVFRMVRMTPRRQWGPGSPPDGVGIGYWIYVGSMPRRLELVDIRHDDCGAPVIFAVRAMTETQRTRAMQKGLTHPTSGIRSPM